MRLIRGIQPNVLLEIGFKSRLVDFQRCSQVITIDFHIGQPDGLFSDEILTILVIVAFDVLVSHFHLIKQVCHLDVQVGKITALGEQRGIPCRLVIGEKNRAGNTREHLLKQLVSAHLCSIGKRRISGATDHSLELIGIEYTINLENFLGHDLLVQQQIAVVKIKILSRLGEQFPGHQCLQHTIRSSSSSMSWRRTSRASSMRRLRSTASSISC